MVRIAAIVLLLCAIVQNTGCARLAGYTYERGPCVIDPRGVPVEPCVYCEPVDPTCCDSNACDQCRWGRETFFDSMYALFCECNLCPNSHCCDNNCP
ncbi:hypothetical protein [Aeoliella sp.]|uniref:hypothetical protein n=1 Tax=Aeoliella sp. TaxID=2795800 RepID=UPI003CCC23DD